MTIQELSVRVGADLSDLDDVAGKVDRKLQGVQDRLSSIGKGMTAALTLPIGVIAGAATRAAVQFDNLERGLRAVSSSSEEAESQLRELREVAKLPGLGLQEAIQGATRLQAAGLAAETSTEALRVFGNALATVGAGRGELSGVILALTQIQAKGKVAAQEINQLAERVPQIRRVMEAAFGTSDTEELQRMGLTSTQFIEAIIDELGKLPPVSTGIGNAIENMQDTVTEALRTIGDAITPMVEQMIDVAVPAVERFTEAFAGMSEINQRFAVVGAGVVAALGPALYVIPKVIAGITALKGAAAALPAAFGPVGAAVAAAAAAGYLLYRNWEEVSDFIQSNFGPALESLSGAWEEIRETAMDVWESVGEIIKVAMEEVQDVITAVADDIAAFWEEWGSVISGVVIAWVDQVLNLIRTAFRLIADAFGAFADLIQGDWHGLFTRLQNMGATALEFVGDSFINFAEVALSALQVLFKAIPGLSNKIEDLRTRLQGITLDLRVEETKAKMGEVEQVVFDLQEELEEETPVNVKTDGAREQIGQIGLDAAKIMQQVERDLSVAEGLAQLFGGHIGAASEKVDILQRAVKKLLQEGFSPTSEKVQEIVTRLDTAKRQLLEMKAASFGSVEGIGFEAPTVEQQEAGLMKIMAKVELVGAEQFAKDAEDVLDIGAALEAGIADVFNEMALSVGESITSLIQGTASMGQVLGNIGRAVVSSLASIAERVGRLMIGFGVAGLALKKIAMGNPVAAIAAGSALLALAGAARAAVSRAVNSGSGGGAYAQPEINERTVYQPASTSQGGAAAAADTRTGQQMDVNLSIQGTSLAGRDILFTVEKTEESYDRQGTARQ